MHLKTRILVAIAPLLHAESVFDTLLPISTVNGSISSSLDSKAMCLIVLNFTSICVSIGKCKFPSSIRQIVLPEPFIIYTVIILHDTVSMPHIGALFENLAAIKAAVLCILNLGLLNENQFLGFTLLDELQNLRFLLNNSLESGFSS